MPAGAREAAARRFSVRAPGSFVALLGVLQPFQQFPGSVQFPGQHLTHYSISRTTASHALQHLTHYSISRTTASHALHGTPEAG